MQNINSKKKPSVCLNGLALSALCLFFLAGTGCVKASFTEPVSSFQKSINDSSAALTDYYLGLNQLEREMYLDNLLYNPSEYVSPRDANGNETPLIHTAFSSESIKARTDLIVLIGIYANRLSVLAGTDAGEELNSAFGELGGSLSSLDETFNGLAGSDTGASDYIGPITTILGVLGERYVEGRRDALLERYITEGNPVITRALNLLDRDMQSLGTHLNTTGLSIALADRVRVYNERVDAYTAEGEGHIDWPLEERRQMLEDIESIADRYQAATLADPTEIIQAMREAHAALIEFAMSDREPEDLAEIVSALETFKGRIETVAGAIDAIYNAGDE